MYEKVLVICIGVFLRFGWILSYTGVGWDFMRLGGE